MKLLKTSIPAFFIIGLLVIGYFYFSKLPENLQLMVPYLPYFLALFVTVVALYFNTSSLFYLGLIIMLALFGDDKGLWAISIELLFVVCCLMTLAVSLLPERGLFGWASLPVHIINLSLLGLTQGLATRQPDWLSELFEYNLLLADYWVATELPQVLVLLWLLCCAITSLWLFFKQQRGSFNALITLLGLLSLFITDGALINTLTAIAALLILLLSALQNAWHLAYVDELTALPGRRALEERLQRSLGIYALAMVDVDHFKNFNDTYGHDVGDDVLRMIAAKIGEVAGGGVAYRYGGEEFTIFFNNHSASEVKQHLQAVIDDVATTPFVVNRRKGQKPKAVQVTVSIGVTDSIGHANASDTIKTADQALYTAKKKGRNRLHTRA
ncbi:GGDEF domain-containing protein [Marinicella sp. S1101]|uniref:GGDEF domain-containing protein n=1 Tax=Marinicella marina TaxID=2996016 RepID=UPI002260F505|nr:GGDEF domain-containing protein [Marinicella marina]MCX7553362.1 GGDEF domain-containing protein [Marinicella marina]MDJ1139094.1 GGDEF domain-containing protein [Marinicella marina]